MPMQWQVEMHRRDADLPNRDLENYVLARAHREAVLQIELRRQETAFSNRPYLRFLRFGPYTLSAALPGGLMTNLERIQPKLLAKPRTRPVSSRFF
jgi:hypothetical protein